MKSPERERKKTSNRTTKSCLPKPEIDLTNPEFTATLSLLEHTNQSVFLSGKAGTGKSTLLRYITSSTKKKYVILAPTGIAAVNVGGQTLHSFFKIPLKPLLPNDPDFAVNRLRQRLKYSNEHIKLIRSLDLIIIDEISMVRADIIDFIDKVLRVYSGNMRLPFGGKQLLFVGDVFQLEPVVTGNDRDVLSHAYSSFYFFSANVFKDINLVPIELSKVYRQEDRVFVNLLDNIRMGRPTQHDLELLHSRYKPDKALAENPKDFTMTIATRRDMVDAINDRHLKALPTPSVIFKGVIENDFPMHSLPTDLNLELKTGAQVVFIKNDPERRWVNGTVAVIETCLPDCITVRTEDGEEHIVEIERWNNVKYQYNEKTHQVDEIELGSFMQYPLKPAWALTIHKSQGLTFNKVIIDIGRGAFAGGQTYVALSRCRSLDGITLINPITPRDIYIRNDIARFASNFNNPALIESAIETSKADTLFRSASKALEDKRFGDAIQNYTEALILKPEIGTKANVIRLLRLKALKMNEMLQTLSLLDEKLKENNSRFAKIADRYIQLASELKNDGWEGEAAISQYNKALEVAPDYPPALLGKAEVLARMGQIEEARETYNEFINTGCPEIWQGHLGLCELSIAQGDPFMAIASLLEAHDCVPESPIVLNRLIELYNDIGDPESAIVYKRKLAKMKRARRK